MKAIWKIFLFIFFLFCIVKCLSTKSGLGYTNGTVKYLSIEGGFYGIVTDDKKNLNPLNLSIEYQVDGKRIQFKYVEKKEMASFHMWGMIVEISEIQELR